MKVLIQGKKRELLIGMDAEFFVRNPKGYVAASRVIPGLKHEPFVLENGVCHPDGLSLEVGAPPAKTPEGMISNLFAVLEEVQRKYLTPNYCTLAYTQEVKVQDVQAVQPDDLLFGCGTEYDAYSQDMIKAVRQDNGDKRYSGFHIHLGFTKGQESNYFTFKDMSRLVFELDALFRAHGLHTLERRATQYGGFGAFRVKPYGIEYRMMDCTVITDADKLQRLLAALNKLPSIFAKLSKEAV